MTTENETPKPDAIPGAQQPAPKPSSPAAVRKAVVLGKEMRKDPNASKADVARKMFETIADEPREVIVQAFVDERGSPPRVHRRTSTTVAVAPIRRLRPNPDLKHSAA